MGKSYCRACADALGLKRGIDTSEPLRTRYQRKKRVKHTQASTSHAVQSVFDSRSTAYYQECIEEAISLGAVEYDDSSRTNIVYCPSTGSHIGSKFKWGTLASRVDTVVVVRTSDPRKLHSYLENSSRYSAQRCLGCGGPMLQAGSSL